MLIGRPTAANSAKTATASTPAAAPGSARGRSHIHASTPPIAAASSTGGCRISPIRRGMYSGTLATPLTRPSVAAVWRVLLSDHNASPVIAKSLSTHTSGAAAASSASRTISRRVFDARAPSRERRPRGRSPAGASRAGRRSRNVGFQPTRYSQ